MDDERLFCSCGMEITPRFRGDEGWMFHVFGGHEVSVIEALGSNVTDEWMSPPDVLSVLGQFELDPCAHPQHRTRCAARGYCLPEENGLLLPWEGRVWCNPPFGRELPKWIERMAVHNNGVMLAPARTETAWFRIAWREATAILFPYRRLRYLRPDLSPGTSPTFPDALIAFGKKNAQELAEARKELNGALVWGITA